MCLFNKQTNIILSLYASFKKENPLSVIRMMNCYTHNEMFLNIFLEIGGPKVIVDTIKITTDEQVLKQIMIFVHALMAQKNICKRFLKDRLYVW